MERQRDPRALTNLTLASCLPRYMGWRRCGLEGGEVGCEDGVEELRGCEGEGEERVG